MVWDDGPARSWQPTPNPPIGCVVGYRPQIVLDNTRTTLAYVSVRAYGVVMDSTTTDAIMTTQMAAVERVERARFEVRLAELRISTSVRGLPLREQVADGERMRAADAELADALAALDAAQDIDCSEA